MNSENGAPDAQRPNDGLGFVTIARHGAHAARIIDQTRLPHRFETVDLVDVAGAARAISDMLVRGAPLIGATAAYGMALQCDADPSDAGLADARSTLAATRPTAVNLAWALARMMTVLSPLPPQARAAAAWAEADAIVAEDVALNRAIGEHGLALLRRLAQDKPAGRPLQVLTHCNAGALATAGWGTATAPIYLAREAGLDLHVWVDETRPRLQGAALTSWELGRAGVAHSVISDNSGGHLMRAGEVDIVFVGTDRVAANGDVANKIGTYLKALAARDNGVPFYVCLPSPTIDFSLSQGDAIPIEERSAEEVTHIEGVDDDGASHRVRITPESAAARNHAFDVTPARLVDGLITERGVIAPSTSALAAAFPERASAAA